MTNTAINSNNTNAANGSKTARSNKDNIRRMVLMAMLAAISLVMVMFIRIPLFPAAPYLEYDMADIPIMLGAFLLGPSAGLTILFIASTIQAFFLGGNGIIGLIMHFVASGALIVVASIIYRRGKEKTSKLIIGLILGSLTMTGLMIPFNLLFTPILTGMPVNAVAAMILPILLPFNLLKAGCNSLIFFFIFKSIRYYLKDKQF